LALELLHQYGCSEYSRGAQILYFDKIGAKKAKHQIRELFASIDKLENLYCVESNEGDVITAGHRIRPIRRDFRPGSGKTRR